MLHRGALGGTVAARETLAGEGLEELPTPTPRASQQLPGPPPRPAPRPALSAAEIKQLIKEKRKAEKKAERAAKKVRGAESLSDFLSHVSK